MAWQFKMYPWILEVEVIYYAYLTFENFNVTAIYGTYNHMKTTSGFKMIYDANKVIVVFPSYFISEWYI